MFSFELFGRTIEIKIYKDIKSSISWESVYDKVWWENQIRKVEKQIALEDKNA